MAQRDTYRAGTARRRIDPGNPLHDIVEDPHDAARRRLERRLSGRVSYSDLGVRYASSNRSSRRARAFGGVFSLIASRGRLGISALVTIVIVVAVTLFVTQGGSEVAVPETEDQTLTDRVSQAQETEGTEDEDPYADVVADMSLLPDDLDEELVAELETLAASDGRVAYIINTIGTVFGDDVADETSRFLQLAVDDSESIDFILGFVDNYPQEEGQSYDEEVEVGTVPLLLQWDARWGYTQYCSESFAAAGCGPTSFAMVYMGITGDTSLTPYDMGVYATEHGYAVDYQGTIGAAFFSDISAELGLSCISFSPDASALEWYLNNGYVVICNVGPGDFTTSGHFIVVTGMNDEGELIINDPYSTVRSAQTWDVDRVMNQSRTLFAFSAA